MKKNLIVAQRIKLARERKGWTQKALAEKCGVHQVTIAKWETGAQLPHRHMKNLASVLEIDVFLLLGEPIETVPIHELATKASPRMKRNLEMVLKNIDVIPFPEMHELKVVEGRAAADFSPAFSKSVDTVWVDKRFSDQNHYGIIVHGSSMANTICEGDIAIVRKQGWILEEFDPERGAALKHEWKRLHDKIVLASVNDEEPLCKRIQILDLPKSKVGFFIQLCSDNCQSPPKPIWQTDRLVLLGIVVATVRLFEQK